MSPRILMVADVSAEKLLGGAERMLIRHVKALAGIAKLTLLTRQPDPEAPLTVEVAEGVTEHRLPFSGGRGVGGMLQLVRGAKEWWPEHLNEFDMVVSEQPFVMWALLRAGCRLPRLQVCYAFAYEEYATRHGLDWSLRHKSAAAAMRWLEGRVYTSAQGLLVLSEYSKRRLYESFYLGTIPVVVAFGGVDAPRLANKKEREESRRRFGWDAPTVVTLRNLVPRTGVDMLVEAAAILRHQMPEVRWCVIGQGALLEPLKWLAKQLDVEDIVEFTGFLPEDEVVSRLQAADAFMLPTRSLEGFGLVTVEANANGLPVVGTPVGAIPEVVPTSPDNILAEATHPEALAEAIRELLERREDHAIRAKRLHAHAKKQFSWSLHDDVLIRTVQAMI